MMTVPAFLIFLILNGIYSSTIRTRDEINDILRHHRHEVFNYEDEIFPEINLIDTTETPPKFIFNVTLAADIKEELEILESTTEGTTNLSE